MFYYIGAFFVCLWIADFITGLAHWVEDTYCLEDMPLIGGFICEPNIDHHLDPQLMVRTGTFFSRNILQWSICGAVFGGLYLVGLGSPLVLLTLVMASFGNEIHRWNHMNKTGPFVTFLKDTGLIQVQRQHSMHHKKPFNHYYCVMTSFTNAVLERLHFWRGLEWVVATLTGIEPKRENRRDSLPLKKNRKKTTAIKAHVGPKPPTTSTNFPTDEKSSSFPKLDLSSHPTTGKCKGCSKNCKATKGAPAKREKATRQI